LLDPAALSAVIPMMTIVIEKTVANRTFTKHLPLWTVGLC
jgi:hypothetical protein